MSDWSQKRKKGDYSKVTENSGLYKLLRGDNLVYVGQSKNVRKRLKEHEAEPGWGHYKWTPTTGVPTNDRKRKEKKLIGRHKPPWNDKNK